MDIIWGKVLSGDINEQKTLHDFLELEISGPKSIEFTCVFRHHQTDHMASLMSSNRTTFMSIQLTNNIHGT